MSQKNDSLKRSEPFFGVDLCTLANSNAEIKTNNAYRAHCKINGMPVRDFKDTAVSLIVAVLFFMSMLLSVTKASATDASSDSAQAYIAEKNKAAGVDFAKVKAASKESAVNVIVKKVISAEQLIKDLSYF